MDTLLRTFSAICTGHSFTELIWSNLSHHFSYRSSLSLPRYILLSLFLSEVEKMDCE